MELEGLKRCRAYLDLNNVAVEQLTTDRHVSVKVYMKNSWKAVKHYFDTWHLTKGMLESQKVTLYHVYRSFYPNRTQRKYFITQIYPSISHMQTVIAITIL